MLDEPSVMRVEIARDVGEGIIPLLAQYDAMMRKSSKSEYLDTGEALELMADMAKTLRAIETTIEKLGESR